MRQAWKSASSGLAGSIAQVSLYFVFPLLAIGLSAGFRAGFAQPVPSKERLVHFHRRGLNAAFYGDRMDAIAGLARMGNVSREVVPELVNKIESDRESPFYRMLAGWALARIGTSEARRAIRDMMWEEPDLRREARLDFPIFAARVAMLAAAQGENRNLDRYLPPLYNRSRTGNLTERILAGWALLEIGTPVTRETARRGLNEVSRKLDPEHGNYTRHLRYLRLLGAHAPDTVITRLAAILETHDFGISIARKRSLTAYTIATIAYPERPDVLERYLSEVAEELESVVFRGGALRDVVNLGPFACSDTVVNELRSIAVEASDDDDRAVASDALSVCGRRQQ